MDVKKMKEIIEIAKSADLKFNSKRYLPTLASIDYRSDEFFQLDVNIRIIYFMLLGKLYMNEEDYPKGATMLVEAARLAEASGQMEKYLWAEIQRGRLFDQKGTVGDRKHAQSIFKKAADKAVSLKLDQVKACCDFYETLTYRLYSSRCFDLRLTNSMDQLKSIYAKYRSNTSRIIVSCINECAIWQAVQMFRAGDSINALKVLRAHSSWDMYIYLMSSIESAFILVFGLNEYGYAKVLLDEVSDYLDNANATLKLLAVMSRIVINAKQGKEYYDEMDVLKQAWERAGDLTKATFQKYYDNIIEITEVK